MPAAARFSLVLLLALTATAGFAAVGEPVAKIKERMGPGKPNPQSPGMVFWLIETNTGPLVYTVTPNAKDISIAEGLKPLKNARLTQELALGFISEQVLPFKDSPTARVVPPGEKYEFAKQSFTCAKHEYVLLDEPNGVLLVWNQSPASPSVIMVTTEMLLRGK